MSDQNNTDSIETTTGRGDSQINQLISLGAPALIGAAIGCVLALILGLVLLLGDVASKHRESMAKLATDNLEQQLNGRQKQLIKQLSAAATSIRLTQLIQADDSSATALEEARLREMIPHAIRVRLFTLGEAEVDREASPPFGFTSLDMVNRTEIGEVVSPEAINANGRWLLSLSVPVRAPSDPAIRGTLFIYLDPVTLSDTLGDGSQGAVKIIQQINQLPANEIFSFGNPVAGTPEITRQLDNPIWQLKHQPSGVLLDDQVISFADIILPIGIFLICALGGAVSGAVRVRKRIDADTSLLASQMADVVNQRYVASDQYQFSGFLPLDAALGRFGTKAVRPEVEKLNVTLQPREPTPEELVDIEMVDDETMEEFDDQLEELELELELDDGGTVDDIASVFRAYDIRGVVGEALTADVVHRIGLAIGTYADKQGEQTLAVGGDGRLSTPEFMTALINGITDSGRDVINIGLVPTPVLYYAVNNSEATSGVMVTGSHNAAKYNGFKIVIAGKTLVESQLQDLYQIFSEASFITGSGEETEFDIQQDYADAIVDDVVVAQPLKIVIDCGNGIASQLAPLIYTDLGCDVIPLYCEVDGNFPNHHPDPTIAANLEDLIRTVSEEDADLGLAFDGDGDRIVAVTRGGEIIWPDQLLMLFAKDVVSRNPGSDVVYDIKCTRHLNSVISSFGGRPIMSRSGHSFVKAKMRETGALLGGELSGHICFQERWFGFDDGLYAGARLLEIVGSQAEGLAELIAEFPASKATPEIQIAVDERVKFDIVDKIIQADAFGEGAITTIDGLRVDFANGWGLVRASNTSACLTLRFEADDEPTLTKIQDQFREQLQLIDSNLVF